MGCHSANEMNPVSYFECSQQFKDNMFENYGSRQDTKMMYFQELVWKSWAQIYVNKIWLILKHAIIRHRKWRFKPCQDIPVYVVLVAALSRIRSGCTEGWKGDLTNDQSTLHWWNQTQGAACRSSSADDQDAPPRGPIVCCRWSDCKFIH